jgi:hypothetical protein
MSASNILKGSYAVAAYTFQDRARGTQGQATLVQDPISWNALAQRYLETRIHRKKKIQPSNMYLSPSRPHELRFLLLKVPHLRTTYVHISITLPGLMINIQETRRSWHLELLICPAYSLTHTEVLNKMNACCCLRKLCNQNGQQDRASVAWAQKRTIRPGAHLGPEQRIGIAPQKCPVCLKACIYYSLEM